MKTKLQSMVWNIYFFFFRLDLKYSSYIETKNSVYDHLGPIDTLGNASECGFFTSAYHDEMVSIYNIHLPFRYTIALVNFEGYEIRFERRNKYSEWHK